MPNTWSELQAEAPFLVLDGAMGTELERAGAAVAGHPLWSALALLKWPKAVRDIHLAYAQAGADILTTATYQASLPGLRNLGLNEAEATNYIDSGVALAAQAIEAHQEAGGSHTPLIAASIGPYGAYLANRSEYSGDYGVSSAALYEFHAPRMDILANSDADILACETIPSLAEGEILVDLLSGVPEKPAWVSFSCKDGLQTSHGEDIQKCVDLCTDHSHIWAGVNCIRPELANSLLETTQNHKQGLRVVYSNREFSPPSKGGSGCPNQSIKSLAATWVQADVHVVGGCCGTSPDLVRTLVQLKTSLAA